MLTVPACQLGVHQTPTPIVPTPTTPPNATACSQVYGFSGALAFDLPGFQLPAGTVGVQRAVLGR